MRDGGGVGAVGAGSGHGPFITAIPTMLHVVLYFVARTTRRVARPEMMGRDKMISNIGSIVCEVCGKTVAQHGDSSADDRTTE